MFVFFFLQNIFGLCMNRMMKSWLGLTDVANLAPTLFRSPLEYKVQQSYLYGHTHGALIKACSEVHRILPHSAISAILDR